MTKIENTPQRLCNRATVVRDNSRCSVLFIRLFVRPPTFNDQTCFSRVDGVPTDRAGERVPVAELN